MRTSTVCILLLGCMVMECLAGDQTSHTEHDSINFYYDPVGKYLVAQTFSSCFMSKLTPVEQDHVHTNTGMEDLELMMLRDVLGKVHETRIYHDSTLPANIQKWCGDRDLFLLERLLTQVVTTSGTVILG